MFCVFAAGRRPAPSLVRSVLGRQPQPNRVSPSPSPEPPLPLGTNHPGRPVSFRAFHDPRRVSGVAATASRAARHEVAASDVAFVLRGGSGACGSGGGTGTGHWSWVARAVSALRASTTSTRHRRDNYNHRRQRHHVVGRHSAPASSSAASRPERAGRPRASRPAAARRLLRRRRQQIQPWRDLVAWAIISSSASRGRGVAPRRRRVERVRRGARRPVPQRPLRLVVHIELRAVGVAALLPARRQRARRRLGRRRRVVRRRGGGLPGRPHLDDRRHDAVKMRLGPRPGRHLDGELAGCGGGHGEAVAGLRGAGPARARSCASRRHPPGPRVATVLSACSRARPSCPAARPRAWPGRRPRRPPNSPPAASAQLRPPPAPALLALHLPQKLFLVLLAPQRDVARAALP